MSINDMTAKIYQINFSCLGLIHSNPKQAYKKLQHYTVHSKVHKKVKHVASMFHATHTDALHTINNPFKVEFYNPKNHSYSGINKSQNTK